MSYSTKAYDLHHECTVIATQLVDALRKVSPGLRATASASSVHKGQIVVLIDADDALRVIDFINDNTATADEG